MFGLGVLKLGVPESVWFCICENVIYLENRKNTVILANFTSA